MLYCKFTFLFILVITFLLLPSGVVFKTIIGNYERSANTTSIEVASKISDVLEVSLDFLLGKTSIQMDKTNMERLHDNEAQPEEDRFHIFHALDNLIKAQQIFHSPMGRPLL